MQKEPLKLMKRKDLDKVLQDHCEAAEGSSRRRDAQAEAGR